MSGQELFICSHSQGCHTRLHQCLFLSPSGFLFFFFLILILVFFCFAPPLTLIAIVAIIAIIGIIVVFYDFFFFFWFFWFFFFFVEFLFLANYFSLPSSFLP